jgi:hypothetical protein
MIVGQILMLEKGSTILAFSSIANIEVLARKFDNGCSPFDKPIQSYDGWEFDGKPDPPNGTFVLLYHLYLSEDDHDDCLLPGDNL